MEENRILSFEVRLVIARMARLVRKFDHLRTGLSNEEDIVHLLEVAASHPRPEVRSIYDEMLYIMSDQELSWLQGRGHALPKEYACRLKPERVPSAEAGKPCMMYRGQVVK